MTDTTTFDPSGMILTAEQVAQLTGFSIYAVRNAARDGKIPATCNNDPDLTRKVYRFLYRDLPEIKTTLAKLAAKPQVQAGKMGTDTKRRWEANDAKLAELDALITDLRQSQHTTSHRVNVQVDRANRFDERLSALERSVADFMRSTNSAIHRIDTSLNQLSRAPQDIVQGVTHRQS